MQDHPSEQVRALAQSVRDGSRRALARGVSWLEAFDPRGAQLLADLRHEPPNRDRAPSHVLGVTGAPGSGKSTLVDRLVAKYRAGGHRVAVLAVDPTSPFSGGAILGDRIRMTRWYDDAGVYVRSLATRGYLGGLAAATLPIVGLLEAAGFDRILLETVGVGQSEVDVAALADTTVLVLTPDSGDGVQAFKAGVSEIADVFVVNKSDLPGADQVRSDVLAAQRLATPEAGAWVAPVVLTRSATGQGIDELVVAINDHAAHVEAFAPPVARQERQARAELLAALRREADRTLARAGPQQLDAIARGERTAERVARDLLCDTST